MRIQRKKEFLRKLARMPQAAKDEIRAAMRQSADEMVDMMKRAAPVDSGALRDSIGYTFGEYRPANSNVRGVRATAGGHDLSVTIHAGDDKAWYAALVEFGTAPHVIRPKRAKALGKDGLFGTRVNHPGASPQPFFFPSWRLGRKRAKSRISRAVTRAAKKVAAGT